MLDEGGVSLPLISAGFSDLNQGSDGETMSYDVSVLKPSEANFWLVTLAFRNKIDFNAASKLKLCDEGLWRIYSLIRVKPFFN